MKHQYKCFYNNEIDIESYIDLNLKIANISNNTI